MIHPTQVVQPRKDCAASTVPGEAQGGCGAPFGLVPDQTDVAKNKKLRVE